MQYRTLEMLCKNLKFWNCKRFVLTKRLVMNSRKIPLKCQQTYVMYCSVFEFYRYVEYHIARRISCFAYPKDHGQLEAYITVFINGSHCRLHEITYNNVFKWKCYCVTFINRWTLVSMHTLTWEAHPDPTLNKYTGRGEIWPSGRGHGPFVCISCKVNKNSVIAFLKYGLIAALRIAIKSNPVVDVVYQDVHIHA